MKTQANKCFLSFVNPRFYTDSQDHFSIGHESRGDGGVEETVGGYVGWIWSECVIYLKLFDGTWHYV